LLIKIESFNSMASWMRGAGFGAQGQESARDCAFHVCTICKAPVRMSYWVPIFWAYQIWNIARSASGWTFELLFWSVLQATGQQVILLATVLCHEFGHGNMARYLGGEIAFVLLWVFGGICFSSRARSEYDAEKILRNELLVVVAGPCTHFLQTPVWGLFLWLLSYLFFVSDVQTGYSGAWAAFTAAMNPFQSFHYETIALYKGIWVALPWSLVGWGIQLNVVLFVFNVFFPMYPADGSKLLVCTLMFVCGMPARKAALILIGVAVPCAALLIAYAGYSVYMMIRFRAGMYILGFLAGWMGVMSLAEVHNIWTLRKARRLHEHPLFQTARSWQTQQRDEFGVVHRLNVSDFDDDAPMRRVSVCGVCFGGSRDRSEPRRGILACMFPCCVRRRAPVSDTIGPTTASGPAYEARLHDLRGQRQTMLDRLETTQGRRP